MTDTQNRTPFPFIGTAAQHRDAAKAAYEAAQARHMPSKHLLSRWRFLTARCAQLGAEQEAA